MDEILRPKIVKTIERDDEKRIKSITEQHLDLVADVAKALVPVIRAETTRVAKAVEKAADDKIYADEVARLDAKEEKEKAAVTAKAEMRERLRKQVAEDEDEERRLRQHDDPKSPTATNNEMTLAHHESRMVPRPPLPPSKYERDMAGANQAAIIEDPEAQMRKWWKTASPAQKSMVRKWAADMESVLKKIGEQVNSPEFGARIKAEIAKNARLPQLLRLVAKRAEQHAEQSAQHYDSNGYPMRLRRR